MEIMTYFKVRLNIRSEDPYIDNDCNYIDILEIYPCLCKNIEPCFSARFIAVCPLMHFF